MQALWEQSVSFKQALAIAAAQKRRFDATLQQQEQRNAGLEQQIEQLKLELAKYKADTSPELLLATCFNLGNLTSPTEEEKSSELFSVQLETLAISATLWNRAAEILPSSIHGFFCQVLDYISRRRSQPDNNDDDIENSAAAAAAGISPSGSPHLAAGTPTPTQSLIQLTHDIITAPSLSPKTEEILSKAASCLGELCKHPNDCLTVEDFSLLQEFISTLITASACCSSTLTSIENKGEENNTEIDSLFIETKAATNDEATTISAVSPSSRSSLRLLEALQSSCGTGYLVLGCAAHTLQSFIQRLRGIVTGEIILELKQPPPPPPPKSNLGEEAEFFTTEESLVTAYGHIASILQSCLRELPSWSVELPFQDEFLREIATAVWDVSAASSVIAPAHGEIAKQGQRCAALLVSALQKMSATNSGQDCGTITMNAFE